MYSTPVILHTISQQHVMYSTPPYGFSTPISPAHCIVHYDCPHCLNSTLRIVHLWLSTPSQQPLRIVHLCSPHTTSLNSTLCIVHLWLSHCLSTPLHIVHLWFSHTISQQHIMYSTPVIVPTVSQQHVTYSTHLWCPHHHPQQHIVAWNFLQHDSPTLCQSTLHIVHLWFSTHHLSKRLNGLRKGEIGMASWVSRLRKSVIACFPWKVRKGWLTHKQTEWSLLLFFSVPWRRADRVFSSCVQHTHTAVQQHHRGMCLQGRMGRRHAVTMLMSYRPSPTSLWCVLITQCAPILMEVSMSLPERLIPQACVSVEQICSYPISVILLSLFFIFLFF